MVSRKLIPNRDEGVNPSAQISVWQAHMHFSPDFFRIKSLFHRIEMWITDTDIFADAIFIYFAVMANFIGAEITGSVVVNFQWFLHV